MISVLRHALTGGEPALPGSAAGPRNIARDFRQWTRAIYIVLPIVILLNYLIIFHWPIFESASRTVWPDHSFHPAPFPHVSHSGDTEGGGKEKDKNGKEKDYWTWDTPSQFVKPTLNWNLTSVKGNECETFPTHLLRKIQVVLKVGAADHWSRTEGQLNSVIKCIANVMVVSDLSHPYGTEHEAMDVLADLPAESYLKEEDYQIYDHQRNVSIGEGKLEQGHEGWKIDKYKFLPEVEKAVERNTDAEWYVFLESDTYIFWDNMFRLLENYDHSEPYYFGSASPGRGIPDLEDHIWFAYGGCGFVLSNAAAHRLVDRKRNNVGIKGPRLSEEYKEDIQRDCCGDSMLGWAIYDKAGVTLSGLWPMFSPHSLAGLPFGKHYWCEPVISLHKTAASEFQNLWKWENSRDRSGRPLLYADLLAYHSLGTFSRREDWDAADWDGFTEPDDHPAHTSLDACDAACKANAQCYQFTWHGKHCYMARSIRLGHHKNPDGKHAEEDRRYVSGWDVGKIERWKEEHKCTEGAHWVKPSLERIF